MEDAAEQKTLATTLKNVTDATDAQVAAAEKWIDVTQRATGVADSELRPALGLLTRQTKDTTEAQKLLGIAMDVSQGTGKDLNTVAAAMVKILEGNTGAASKLVPELTGIAREGAPAAEVMDALAKTFAGQTAEHAGTLEGKMARLNVAFAEMKERVGAALLPKLTELGDWLLDTGIPKMEEIATKVGNWWAKQDELRQSIQDSITQAKEFTEALIPLGKEAWEAYLKVKPLVDVLVKWQQLSGGLGAFGTGGGSVVEDLKNVGQGTGGAVQGFASGGMVPGPVGAPRLIVAHGGERVQTPAQQGSGGGVMIVQLVVDSRVLGEVAIASINRQQRGLN